MPVGQEFRFDRDPIAADAHVHGFASGESARFHVLEEQPSGMARDLGFLRFAMLDEGDQLIRVERSECALELSMVLGRSILRSGGIYRF